MMREKTAGSNAGEDRRRTTDMDAHIGNRLRVRRLQLGLSQEQLGDATGITFQQIQKYENGTNRIAASRLFELAKILNVSILYFFEGSSGNGRMVSADAQDDPDIMEVLRSPQGMALNKAFLRIEDERLRRSIVMLLSAVADRKQED